MSRLNEGYPGRASRIADPLYRLVLDAPALGVASCAEIVACAAQALAR